MCPWSIVGILYVLAITHPQIPGFVLTLGLVCMSSRGLVRVVVLLECHVCCVHPAYPRTSPNYVFTGDKERTLQPPNVAWSLNPVCLTSQQKHVTNEGISSCFPESLLERCGLSAFDCIRPFNQHLKMARTALVEPKL